jgi:tetratricopeptide (TPR) repeat protein
VETHAVLPGLRLWIREVTRLVVAAVALLALASPVRAQPAPEHPPLAGLVDAAEDAYRRGDFARARELLLQAYELTPEPALLFPLGQVEFNLGHYKEAIDYYERYLATDPTAEQAALAQQAIGAARMKLAAPPPAPPPKLPPPPPPLRPRPPHREWDGFDTGLAITGGVAALSSGALFYEGNLHSYNTRVSDAYLARSIAIGSAAAGALAIGGALLRWRLHFVETTVSVDAGPTRVGVLVEHPL